jgi:hypothetical protein
MKSGLSRSHWRLDKRLVALALGLSVLATAVYFYVALSHSAG